MAIPPLAVSGIEPPSRSERITLAALCIFVILAAWPLRGWWVEDAAITFSYARNLAHGDGIVAFPGAERSEGYSDPLWMALLSLGELAHLGPFMLSKVLGTLFAAACVPIAWAITARLPVPPTRLGRLAPLIAAAVVATNAQHIIWANAGLENALFSLLLAIGIWRVGVEADRGGVPWSALAFLGVALTRPEGVIYGAAAFGLAGAFDLRRGRTSRPLAWAVAFGGPFTLYHIWHFAYFALMFPLPYYAKMSKHSLSLFDWSTRPWRYLATWSLELGWAFVLPVLLAGVARAQGWRSVAAKRWLLPFAIVALLAMLFPAIPGINTLRIVMIMLLGLWVPLIAFRLNEGPTRTMCASFVVMAIAFTIPTNADWMYGYRRFSVLAVPMAALFAVGVAEIVDWIPGRHASRVAAFLAITPLLWNAIYLIYYYQHPVRMTPMTTRGRVRAFEEMAQRIQLERRWVAVDHAMGGHMWFAAETGRTIDWYGLTEPVFALHHPLSVFALDYLLDPPRFDFAHLEKKLAITKNKRYLREFVRVPKVRGRNDDNWLRRALITAPEWPGVARAVSFANGYRLEGFRFRSPEVSVEGGLYVELGMTRGAGGSHAGSIQLRLHGPVDVVLPLSPGYDGLLPPDKWRQDEVFIGRYAVALPDDLPTGAYSIGFSMTDEVQQVVPVRSPSPGTASRPTDSPQVEARFADLIEVVSATEARELAETDWTHAAQLAAGGDCEGADAAWLDARKHAPRDDDWGTTLLDRAKKPLADCWAARALTDETLSEKITALAKARRWDVRSPAAMAAGRRIGDETWPKAMAAREAGRLTESLALFQSIVEADPTRSWARRYAEEARSAIIVAKVGERGY